MEGGSKLWLTQLRIGGLSHSCATLESCNATHFPISLSLRHLIHHDVPESSFSGNDHQKGCDINPQDDSHLFSLPAELRVQIWSYALHVPPHEDSRYGIALLHTPRHLSSDSALSLLANCKLINQNAAGIFYRDHRLVIQGTSPKPLHSEPPLSPLVSLTSRPQPVCQRSDN